MELRYIANTRFPTERAHGIQIAKMCEAFSEQGIRVEVLVSRKISSDPFVFYQIKKNFDIRKLFTVDLVKFGRIGFWIQSVIFTVSVIIYANRQDENTIYYSRDELVLLALQKLGKKVVWEVHSGRNNPLIRSLIKKNIKFVAISHGLEKYYESLGQKPDRILVAHDAVDVDKFNISISKEEARNKINFSHNVQIILYTGSTYGWKGVDTLKRAATLMSGGEVVFVSNKPHSEIPLYLKAADVLVLPNTAKEDISRLYTSPLKMFEYMASGTPIVASNLPSIREVLNESNANFFEPDNSEDLAQTINAVLHNYDAALQKAESALKDVQAFTWQNRAKMIIAFVLY